MTTEISSALDTLGIDLNPLKTKNWDRETTLRVLKIAIKKAYRYRALDTHPDRFPEKEAEFKQISAAKQLLDSVDSSEFYSLLNKPVAVRKPKVTRSEMKTVSLTLVFHLPVVSRY